MHSPDEFPILWTVEAHQEAMRLGFSFKDGEREQAFEFRGAGKGILFWTRIIDLFNLLWS